MNRPLTGRAFFALLLGPLLPLPCTAQQPNPQVIMETSLGRVRLELFADKAPVSTKNFLKSSWPNN